MLESRARFPAFGSQGVNPKRKMTIKVYFYFVILWRIAIICIRLRLVRVQPLGSPTDPENQVTEAFFSVQRRSCPPAEHHGFSSLDGGATVKECSGFLILRIGAGPFKNVDISFCCLVERNLCFPGMSFSCRSWHSVCILILDVISLFDFQKTNCCILCCQMVIHFIAKEEVLSARTYNTV